MATRWETRAAARPRCRWTCAPSPTRTGPTIREIGSPISGWVAKLNGDPVSWSSKKQRVVALSTCEAELYAEAAAIQEVLWLRGLMEELGLHTQTGSTVYGDNQSTIAVSENGVKGERTKHVDVKYHFVTETVERGAVKLRVGAHHAAAGGSYSPKHWLRRCLSCCASNS